MKRLILALMLLSLFLLPLSACAGSGGQGTLLGWTFHPPETPGACPGLAFSYLTSDGSPLVTLIPLVPAFGAGHWDDPDWTKRDALAPLLEYEKQYGQGSLKDLFGADGNVTFSPEVIYAMKAQGFDPATFGGPPREKAKIVSTIYDTERARNEIQNTWPANFTVQDVGGPIVGLKKGEGGPGVAGKPNLPDPSSKPRPEEYRQAPITPELAGLETVSYMTESDIQKTLNPPEPPEPQYRAWDPRGWDTRDVIERTFAAIVLLFLLYIAYAYIEDRTYLWRYMRKQKKLKERERRERERREQELQKLPEKEPQRGPQKVVPRKVPRRVHRVPRKITSIILILALASSAMPKPAGAADHITFDSNMRRTRMITDNQFGDIIYSDKPVYIPIPGVKSFTDPVVANGVMYQYCYDDNGYGYLYAFDATAKPPVDQNGDPSPQIWNAPQIWSNPAKFNAGFSSYGGSQKNNAAGVAGPTVAHGYVAVGCGDKLYVWPEGGSPDTNGILPGEIIYRIYANRYNNWNQRQRPDEVSSSPVITPPLEFNIGGQLYTLPAVAVGSWSGGFVCGPATVPPDAGVQPDTISFKFYTANRTPNSRAIITSSPAWNHYNGTILFGVDANYPNDTPRMVSFDPRTGHYYEFGMGKILYGIASSPAVANDGHFYVPDKFGGIYKFSAYAPFNFVASNTSFIPRYPSSGNLNIANICVDETELRAIWAIEEHYTKLAVLDMDTLETLTTFGPNEFGTDLKAVTVIASNQSSTGGYGVLSGSKNGQTYIYSDLKFQKSNNSYSYAAISANVPPYASVVPDFGPSRWIVCWTNKNPVNNSPAIQLFIPTNYKIKAFFTQDTTTLTPVTEVLPNENITLVAKPEPSGVTYQVNFRNLDYSFLNNWGLNFLDRASLQLIFKNPETWAINIKAPSQPGTYTVKVTGYGSYDDMINNISRGETTTTLKVVDTIHNNNSMKSNCDYLHVTSYGIPVKYVPPFPPPNTLYPRPCPDFAGNFYGYGNMHSDTVETKLGDTIACRLEIPVNELKSRAISELGKTPEGRLSVRWGKWYVDWSGKYGPQLKMTAGTDTPTLQHPQGRLSEGPNYTTIIEYPTENMVVQSSGPDKMVATLHFTQDWEGYKPRGPYVRGIDPANGKDTQYLQNPITGYSVTAHAWVSLIWVNIPPKGRPEYTVYSFDLYATVPLKITGTSIWIIPTEGGTELFSFPHP